MNTILGLFNEEISFEFLHFEFSGVYSASIVEPYLSLLKLKFVICLLF